MSTLRLFAFNDDDAENPPARNEPPVLTEPLPIQIRFQEVETPSGPVTLQFCVWFDDDAARCRWCKPGTCTYAPTSAGVGTCYLKRDGGLSLPGPTLAREG